MILSRGEMYIGYGRRVSVCLFACP